LLLLLLLSVAAADSLPAGPVFHYRIAPPPEKYSLDRQFTGKNPSRPAAARAGRIFTGKLSAEGRLFWGRSYNRETFMV